ncbi:MAG: penicillin-binding protein activator [Holosporaceae bacterium]|jgi:hypothetical protein|nr:penicillin-binding protein activator [Holosporaceae bacterium]
MYQATKLLLLIIFLLISCTSQKYSTTSVSQKEDAAVDISHATKLLMEKQKMSSNQVLLLLPLSGPHGEIGNSLLKACILSARESHDNQINFYVVDTANPNLEKHTLCEKFNSKNLKAIVGPIFFYEARQLGALFPNIPMFTFSNNLNVNNSHVFSCGISPLDEIRAIFAYAKRRRLYDFLVLLPENELGNQLQQHINQEASQSHFNDFGEVEIIRYRSISSQNIRNFIKNSKKKAVFLVDPIISPKSLADIHVFTLSSSVFAHQERWQGAYFAFSNEQSLKKFKDKYEKAYGSTPGTLEAIGYDICNLLYDNVINGISERFFHVEHKGSLGTFFIKKNNGLMRNFCIKQVSDDSNFTDSDDDREENPPNQSIHSSKKQGFNGLESLK